MNFQVGGIYSVILMSTRPNAPYQDRVDESGRILIYQGHNIAKTEDGPDPKAVDQPKVTPLGKLTENGKFDKAAQEYKQGLRLPEKVKVYEKLRAGIWSYNGVFYLTDSWLEDDGTREVFKFKLVLSDEYELQRATMYVPSEPQRIIPTAVKLEVWKRDDGKCAICGATTELHFDHIIPYSKGGTSLKADNIQLLCARHNLEKRDRIE
ncbi:MAG: HNH endonuclease [Anaerolineae bacterium]|nr:HNH endonuclease [Anaerolineae bacterium]